jgi:hypothetical protein
MQRSLSAASALLVTLGFVSCTSTPAPVAAKPAPTKTRVITRTVYERAPSRRPEPATPSPFAMEVVNSYDQQER